MDAWEPSPAGLHGWSSQYPINGWSARTTAVALPSGELLVFNPGPTISEQGRQVLSLNGRVSHLLAPNGFHYLGVRSWRDSFGPIAVPVAPGAHARLVARLGFHLELLPDATPELAPGWEVVIPDGLKTGEVWLVLRNAHAVAWIVADAFFHLVKTPRNLAGVYLRLSGTTPGLRIRNTFKWGHLQDRTAYRDWILNRLDQDQPMVVVPAHGEVLEDPALSSRLRALVETRLG